MARAKGTRARRAAIAPDADEATQARLAAIAAASHDAIIAANRAGTITDWNPAAERLFGICAHEAVGRSLAIIVPPQPAGGSDPLLARVRRGERVTLDHTVLRAGDRPSREISLEIWPVCDAAGQVIAMSAIGRDVTPRDAIVDALAVSEGRFQTLFARAPVAIALARPDGCIFQVNAACCTLLGYAEGEFLAANIQDITHPDDLEASLILAQRALRGEVSAFQTELRCRRRDGQTISILLSATLVRDDHDNARCFIFRLQDMSGQRETEAELAVTQRHAFDVLARISDGVCELGRDWRLTDLNAAAERLLDRPRDELLGADLWQLFPAEAATAFREACQRAIAQGFGANTELEYTLADAWFEVRVYPAPGGATAILHDVTASKRSEELRRTEARFETIVEHLPIVVYGLAADETESPLYFNPAIEAMFGVTRHTAQARTSHWTTLVHPDDLERVKAKDEAAVNDGERFLDEYRLKHVDGSYVWVRDECIPLRDEDGQTIGAVGVLLDVGDRKQMEDDLRAALEATEVANRAANQVLSTMNHELRTPLQTVLGYADFLRAGKEGPLTPGQAEDVDAISRAARRMIALIDQTLTLAQLQAGQVVLASEPVDLTAVVESVHQDVAPPAAAKGLCLLVDLPASLPRVLGDATAVRQILLNLIDNAIAFTERGTVRISAESSRAGVAVAVSDTGVGIPPELEARVLAELQQWTSGLPRREGGTGLGLAIATKLAEQQGGSISVTSRPGLGSTFTLHLPAVKRRSSSRKSSRTVKRG